MEVVILLVWRHVKSGLEMARPKLHRCINLINRLNRLATKLKLCRIADGNSYGMNSNYNYLNTVDRQPKKHSYS